LFIVVEDAVDVYPIEADAHAAEADLGQVRADIALEEGPAHAAVIGGFGRTEDAGDEFGHVFVISRGLSVCADRCICRLLSSYTPA